MQVMVTGPSRSKSLRTIGHPKGASEDASKAYLLSLANHGRLTAAKAVEIKIRVSNVRMLILCMVSGTLRHLIEMD